MVAIPDRVGRGAVRCPGDRGARVGAGGGLAVSTAETARRSVASEGLGQVGPAGDAEFLVGGVKLVLHGVEGQAEPGGDLLVGDAPRSRAKRLARERHGR